MSQDKQINIKNVLFFIFYYLSAFSFFSLLFDSRPVRIVLFFLMISLLICTYIIIKRRGLLFSKPSKKEIIVTLCIESICYFDFYFNAIHLRSGYIMALWRKIPFAGLLDDRMAFAAIGIIISAIGFLFVRTISPFLIVGFEEIIGIIKKYKKHLILLFAVSVLSFVAIIRANYNYTDDLARTIYGYEITGDFSRYFANILSEIVHGNSWLADISPLPQLIALLIICVTGIILLHVLATVINKEPSWWSFIALIPIGLSPYFLSCLSYKYDAPYMALSVLVSVVPLVFSKHTPIVYSISVFIGALVMCTTYQVSSGIFPMIVLILALIMWIQKRNAREILTFLLCSAIPYVLALVVFRIAIMTPVSQDNYVDVGVSIINLFPNTINYFDIVNKDFPFIWKALMTVIFVSFIVLLIKISKRNKIISALISFAISMLSLVLSFGVYLVFNNPLTEPRAFYGTGVFISIMCCALFLEDKYFIGKVCVVGISWVFIVYSFIYGNALNIQKDYISFRTEQVINECNDLGILDTHGKTKLQLTGSAGYQRAVKNMIQEYPILERQIKVLLLDSNEWYWGTYQLEEYYGLDIEHTDIGELEINNDNKLADTYYYTIYQDNNTIVVDVHNVESKNE